MLSTSIEIDLGADPTGSDFRTAVMVKKQSGATCAMKSAQAMPGIALLLGILGLIPFVALTVASAFTSQALRSWLLFALCAYGAAILSFLGGIHWGLGIGAACHIGQRTRLILSLCFSVIPALVAWASLLLPLELGLLSLSAAMAIMLVADVAASRFDVVPRWYPTLRMPLALIAATSLIAASALR